MPPLNDAVIVAIMSALGGFLVALLNRRSSLEGEQTKRLEILISSQQDAFDRQAQTLTSLEADMIKLRAEWAAERESHHARVGNSKALPHLRGGRSKSSGALAQFPGFGMAPARFFNVP